MDTNLAGGTVLPPPQAPKRRRLLIAAVLAVILAVFTVVFTLFYFKVLPFSKIAPVLNFLPQKAAVVPANSKPVTLSCPIPKEVCSSGLSANYNGHAAIVWRLAKGTVVGAAANVVDSLRFILPPYTKASPVGFYQSFISGNDCYTLTYTFPGDTALTKIDLLPLTASVKLATASASLLNVDSHNVSLVLQMQKRTMDPKDAAKPDFMKCAVTNLKTADFGAYQNLSTDSFK